jgi:hypothetical protein
METAGEWKRKQLRDILERFEQEIMEVMADSHEKGMRWEKEFVAEAKQRGFVVEAPTGREDWVVNGLKVQCKNIDDVRCGWIDISNMRPVKANSGFRGYLRIEIDVLALRHRGRIFLIPSSTLDDDSGRLRGRVTESEVQSFADNWSAFDRDYTPPVRDRQCDLFSFVHGDS